MYCDFFGLMYFDLKKMGLIWGSTVVWFLSKVTSFKGIFLNWGGCLQKLILFLLNLKVQKLELHKDYVDKSASPNPIVLTEKNIRLKKLFLT